MNGMQNIKMRTFKKGQLRTAIEVLLESTLLFGYLLLDMLVALLWRLLSKYK